MHLFTNSILAEVRVLYIRVWLVGVNQGTRQAALSQPNMILPIHLVRALIFLTPKYKYFPLPSLFILNLFCFLSFLFISP